MVPKFLTTYSWRSSRRIVDNNNSLKILNEEKFLSLIWKGTKSEFLCYTFYRVSKNLSTFRKFLNNLHILYRSAVNLSKCRIFFRYIYFLLGKKKQKFIFSMISALLSWALLINIFNIGFIQEVFICICICTVLSSVNKYLLYKLNTGYINYT